MGYYTDYTVTIDVIAEEQKLQIATDLEAISGYSMIECIMSGDGLSGKWYECQDNMRAISRKYPGILFTVTGDGEESGDVWVHYFMNGLRHDANARVVFEDFDIGKLK